MTDYDAIIIGGGFFGCNIAHYVAQYLPKVLIIEQESQLLGRASFVNQARVHNGYHYPRSYTTAYRSRINFPRFIRDYPDCVQQDFTKLYCIARYNSKVTARQFEKFCDNIGAECRPAEKELKNLFSTRLLEQVYQVKEIAFNADCLRAYCQQQLTQDKVAIHFNTIVERVTPLNASEAQVHLAQGETLSSRYVFNCTYSGLNQVQGARTTPAAIKHEITEITLVKVPEPFDQLGITVMDGAFFSIMPFPARQLHSFTHVRYTPHAYWFDSADNNPYQQLKAYQGESRFVHMQRDASRYLPFLQQLEYRDSLFEVKTVLTKNEVDDGRPILFDHDYPTVFSVLGGKIDNIYDILEQLEKLEL